MSLVNERDKGEPGNDREQDYRPSVIPEEAVEEYQDPEQRPCYDREEAVVNDILKPDIQFFKSFLLFGACIENKFVYTRLGLKGDDRGVFVCPGPCLFDRGRRDERGKEIFVFLGDPSQIFPEYVRFFEFFWVKLFQVCAGQQNRSDLGAAA